MGGAPRKRSGLRWLLMGCGCFLVLVLAGIGGCVVFGWWALQKVADDATAGVPDWLRAQPQVERSLGSLTKIERVAFPFNVSAKNAQTLGEFAYTLEGPKGSGTATVWVRKASDVAPWKVVGCELDVGGSRVVIGERLTVPSGGRWDD